MSTYDSRQITIKGDTPKAERLFRASVSAFCSLTRPSRREIAQLEDLTLPLFEYVSVESRRYVAAALSESPYAPTGLVKLLCDQSVDIAAPLLMRSKVLGDIDLIALIGRHGLGHARAIARRPDLHPTIAKLAKALEKKKVIEMNSNEQKAKTDLGQNVTPLRLEPATLPDVSQSPSPGEVAENARRQLRSMMIATDAATTSAVAYFNGQTAYFKLRETALTGNAAFFQTALADALEIDFATARSIVGSTSYHSLMTGLRALDLRDEQAYLIVAAVYPPQFVHPESIRLFLSRYSLMHREVAQERVKMWRIDAVAAKVGKPATGRNAADLPGQAANQDVSDHLPVRMSKSK